MKTKTEEYQCPAVRCFDVQYRERIVKASSETNTMNGEGLDLEDGGIG